MFLATYHINTRQIFHGKRGKKSPFRHMFGGATDYVGLTAHKRQPPVHMLFRLNMEDPAVGVSLDGVQWLPLLCAIRYGACNLGYRVISDEEVRILHQTEAEAWDDFPYKGYPEKLPAKPLIFWEGSYDPNDPKDALGHAGIFGYEAVPPKVYEKLIRQVESEGLPDLFGWESAEAYLEEGNSEPFVQGRPVDDCPEPSCANHGRASSLRTFAIFQEDQSEVRKLWGPNCEDLQIIYQVCPECGAIRTSNQCT